MIRVFVYGSLKTGRHNHRVLHGATRVGYATIRSPYTLYDFGPYPGLVRTSLNPFEPAQVPAEPRQYGGEVYEVDELGLRRLDALEGHPRFYTREIMPTSLGDAWVYTLPDAPEYTRHPAVQTLFWDQDEAELAEAQAQR